MKPMIPAPAPSGYVTIDAAAAIVDRYAQSIASAVRYEKIAAIKRPNGEILVKLSDVEAWSRLAPRHAKPRFTRVSLKSGKDLPVVGETYPVAAPEPPAEPEPAPAPDPSVEIDAKAFLEATRLSAEALVEISATLKVIADALRRERKEF